MTDEEVKDFIAINFREYFKSIREEKNIGKVAILLYIFLATTDEVEKYVQSNPDNCVHHYNVEIWIFLIQNYNWLIKPVIKNKLNELLS